jgi:AraC-like DNA-binding protein
MHFQNFVPDHSIERLVPTGNVFIIFELDGFVRHTHDNETLEPIEEFTKAWVSGMHKNYISISAKPNSEMLAIQLKTNGAYPFLHFPVQDLNDRVVPAQEVFGEEVLHLRQEMLQQSSQEGKLKLAEQWLLKRLNPSLAPPAELVEVLEKIQQQSVVHYTKIVDEYSKTQKHLIDQFKKYIGLTPKYYQRIIRFNEILQAIRQNEKIEWSQIAYQGEYADQSHFIKEFKHFSGFNPQKFIKNDFHHDRDNFFPLDREG